MKKFLFLLLLSVPLTLLAQNVPDVKAHSPKPGKASRVERKALKKKQKKQHKQDVGEKKLRKQLVKMQTKDVKKRMKKNKHKAKLYNGNKREFFLVRWFRKK